MTVNIIITLCVLLLIAYIFDITASKTKIPSIILLLVMGFGLHQVFKLLAIKIPNLEPLLPVLGTIGLILIVLEGSLELKLSKQKLPLIAKSSILALFPIIILSFGIVYAFHLLGGVPLRMAFVNAIPLCIISSAIAIPSARNLSDENKEFVTYESSLSDIFGVIIFNFITLNEIINGKAFGVFFIEIIIMLLISIIASALLSLFIANIKHHIKFIPIILSVTLIYGIAKLFHLPALIFILIFGLALHNIDLLKNMRYLRRLNLQYLKKEVHRFTGITNEFAFLIRSIFFLLFGFFIEVEDVINLHTLPWAIMIVSSIFLLRIAFLALFKLPLSPLLYIAPRGLITILLFLSIPATQQIDFVNNALLIQVILLCALFMMGGLMTAKKIVDIFKPIEGLPIKIPVVDLGIINRSTPKETDNTESTSENPIIDNNSDALENNNPLEEEKKEE